MRCVVTERQPPQLEYGQAPSWPRRRMTRRVMALMFGLLTLGTVLRFQRVLVDRITANYWFAKCMTYEGPKEATAYSEQLPLEFLRRAPIEPWDAFSLRWGGAVPMSQGTVFLHERKTRTGSKRLVAVDVVGTTNGRMVQFQSHVFEPPIGISPARRKSAGIRVLAMPDAEGRLTMQRGKPDLLDASHFVIGYRIGERRGDVDGWLRDDDTIVLEVRADAATRPAPSPGAITR